MLLGIGDAEPETTFVIALFRASSKHVCVYVCVCLQIRVCVRISV